MIITDELSWIDVQEGGDDLSVGCSDGMLRAYGRGPSGFATMLRVLD